MRPDKSKWIIRRIATGRWVVRMPDDLGGWKFTLPTWDTCMVLVEGVEIYRHKFHLTDNWIYRKIS